MRLITCIALFINVTVPGTTIAQTTAESFADLSRVVKKGQVVFVESEQGERVKGNITDLSDTSLQLATGVSGREMTFTADRVVRVSKADSRVNGFLIGAVIGVAGGIYSASMVDMLFENEASNADWTYPVFGGLMGLAGGGIGYAIDGAIDGQKLVFARRGAATRSQARVTPLLGKGVGGVRVSLQF